MADFNGPEPTPRVGIRGNTESIKPIERQEHLLGSGATPNYVGAFSALAATPTSLGQIGSKVLTSISNYQMDRLGYTLGSNPSGDTLPPITDADKRFVQAYSNQSLAVLSLQGEKLMSSGELELANSNKLSPGLIASYTSNMAKGFENLLVNAPSTIRPQLENQLKTNLVRSTNNLQNKLITQQKQDYKDQMTALNMQTNKDIYENAMSGNSSEAGIGLQNQIARNKQLKESGVISEVQEQQSNQTATQTFYTGIYTQKALEEKNNGTLEQYLTDLAENKPEEITFLDWSTVVKNVLGNIGQIDSLEKRDQSLIASQFNLAVLENKVTPDLLAEVKEKLTPDNYTKAMINYYRSFKTTSEKQNNINSLISNWGSPVSHADNTAGTINDSFTILADGYNQRLINQGKEPVSDLEAKIAVMKSSGAPVPRFTNEISNMITSGNPDLMEQASNAYGVLGYQKLPIDASDQRLLFGYNSQIDQGRSPLEAAQIAINNNAPQTEEKQKAIKFQWDNYVRDNKLTDLKSATNHARSLLDIPWFTDVPDLSSIVQKTNSDFESNYRLLGGDLNAAKKLTTENKQLTYGVTYVNGTKQFVYMPIEKFILGHNTEDKNAAGIIQSNIIPQLQKQLESTKVAFDSGTNDYYYRIESRSNYQEALEAKNQINKIENERELFVKDWDRKVKIEELNGIVNSFMNSKPLTIEKVWRSEKGHKEHIEKFQAAIRANDSLGLGLDPNQPISGAYDIVLQSESGQLSPIIGVDSLSNGQTIFRPNINQLQTEYFTLSGSSDVAADIEKAKKEYTGRRKSMAAREEESGPNIPHLLF